MRHATLYEQQREMNRAKAAADWFDEHPADWSLSLTDEGELCGMAEGTYLALRWGDGRSVLLVHLDYETPVVYGDCIKTPPYPRVKTAAQGAGVVPPFSPPLSAREIPITAAVLPPGCTPQDAVRVLSIVHRYWERLVGLVDAEIIHQLQPYIHPDVEPHH